MVQFCTKCIRIYIALFQPKVQFHLLECFLLCFVGMNSKYSTQDQSGRSSSSSKVSMVSVPPTPRSEGEILQSSNVRSFAFSELKTATRNFRPDSVLGEGGFGSVFKGWIDENTFAPAKPGTGIVIAVKRLNQEGVQGHKEWLVSFGSSAHICKILLYFILTLF